MPSFSKRSSDRLNTCHPDLQLLFMEVIKEHDCSILCGNRTQAEQDALFYADPPRTKVKYPNSKHNALPSNAVDVMPYPISWTDMDSLHDFAKFVNATAERLEIDVKWGGTFKGFFDGPHWQLRS